MEEPSQAYIDREDVLPAAEAKQYHGRERLLI